MTRPPEVRLFADEIVVDSFAGGGGASCGIEAALGRGPDIAINHDPEAIAMHAANHPATRHFCESVWKVDPKRAAAGKRVGLAWFSPDCKHFSKAKGGKPVEKGIRGLAWVVVKWARAVRPRIIVLENVEEFADWGPLDPHTQRPDPERIGLTFRRWCGYLRGLGYQIEMRELRACDYGAPTTRRRLFVVARCDGNPIVWPMPTHGRGLIPHRAAAECIEWALPCPSIFGRAKSLAEATLNRIARGMDKYVLNAAEPFIVPVSGSLASPSLIVKSWGEREGQLPRILDIGKPLPTVPAQGIKQALVAAFLARHFGGPNGNQVAGSQMRLPVPTVTARDHHALVATHLTKLYGTSTGANAREPMPTVTAGGQHLAEVRAFLVAYFGTETAGQHLFSPMRTVTSRDRFGLVTVEGVDYEIADIGMRMLVPRELFRAQGFPDSYRIELEHDGKPLTKTSQVRMAGNSVCPPIAEAIVRSQLSAHLARGVVA